MTASPASVDDTEHGVLSKAHEVSQTSIQAFCEARKEARDRPTLPRSTFGTYEVKEVEVDTALTDCQLPGSSWSLNPFTGCSHACAYCYVPDVAHLERDRWGSYVVVKRNLPTKLSSELKRRERQPVFLSSATDPYQPAEARHRITRRCLELLVREDWPVRLLTRSPLVTRDLDLLGELSDVSVGMSIPTLDESARRCLEPGAPPIDGRLNALAELAEAGLRPFANLAPAYPLTNGTRPGAVADAFAKAGVEIVYAGRWNYLDSILPALEDHVEGTIYEEFTDAVEDDRYYDRLFASLNGAFRRAGVPFVEM